MSNFDPNSLYNSENATDSAMDQPQTNQTAEQVDNISGSTTTNSESGLYSYTSEDLHQLNSEAETAASSGYTTTDPYYAQNPYQNNAPNGYQPQNPYGPASTFNQSTYQNPYQGYYQNNGQPGYSQQANPYPAPQSQPVKKKKHLSVGGMIAIIAACAVLFGCAGFFGAWAVARNSAKSVSETSASSEASSRNDNTYPGSNNHGGNDSTTTSQTIGGNSSENLLTIQEVEPMTLQVASGEGTTLSIPDVVDKCADSVVEITTEVVATSVYMQQYITSGAGSGVIISENGYILTNNHVIEDATSITVTLKNGETYTAALVGLDEDLDIALLKIDASGLTPATIGISSDLRVGQTIIAIGNPLGQLGGTVTSGIISAKERSITIDGTTMSLLQIDAAVNPGNSGGALFDEEGTLVGIVNAKSSGDDVEGIGFAIPIDDVEEILDDLLNYGYVKDKPALGITMVDISTSQMASMYRVDELGPYIYSVSAGSAAETAGLQSGDRIVSINGVAVSSGTEVKEQISSTEVGETIRMVVSRNGQEVEITIVMGEYIPSGILGRVSGSLN